MIVGILEYENPTEEGHSASCRHRCRLCVQLRFMLYVLFLFVIIDVLVLFFLECVRIGS